MKSPIALWRGSTWQERLLEGAVLISAIVVILILCTAAYGQEVQRDDKVAQYKNAISSMDAIISNTVLIQDTPGHYRGLTREEQATAQRSTMLLQAAVEELQQAKDELASLTEKTSAAAPAPEGVE